MAQNAQHHTSYRVIKKAFSRTKRQLRCRGTRRRGAVAETKRANLLLPLPGGWRVRVDGQDVVPIENRRSGLRVSRPAQKMPR